MSTAPLRPLLVTRMDLHDLRYFAMVAVEGNFRRASERLHIAQSALSRRIIRLEQELGATLFERTTKGTFLSDAGTILLDHARRIMDECDRSIAHLGQLADGRVGTLRIGLNRVATALPWIAEVFHRFRLAHPGVNLKLFPIPSEPQMDALLAGDLDFGFLFTRPMRSKDFGYRPLLKETFLLALPAEHPLVGADVIRLRDIADEDFVLFSREPNSTVYELLLAAVKARGIELRIVQEGHGEDTQLGLVAAGMGLTFALRSSSERYSRDDIVFKPVIDLNVRLNLEFVWRRGDVSPLHRSFLRVFDKTKRATAT